MFRTLIPIFAILVAVALYFTYIEPTFREIGAVQEEIAQYQDAIDKAEQLRMLVQDLVAQRNSIPLTQLERLEALLPDTIDEMSVLLDLDVRAQIHGMSISSIQVEEGAENERSNSRSSEGETGTPYRSLDISFSVVGTYENFRLFLADLERSLVLNEVMSIEFVYTDLTNDFTFNDTSQTYTMTVRYYALNRES